MPRVPYVADDGSVEPTLDSAIRKRRGGKLLNLDRMLLHSEFLARGWNDYLEVIRNNLTVPPMLKELAICGIAVLNGAEYEFGQHIPLFLSAGGSPEAARALRDLDAAADNESLFSGEERAIMRLTIEMTRSVAVSERTFQNVQAVMSNDKLVVELVAIIATYNMVSRFLVALGVDGTGEHTA